MRESATLALIAHPSSMNPLAWKPFSLMRIRSMLLASLTIVSHEVLTKIEFQIMGQWFFRKSLSAIEALLV